MGKVWAPLDSETRLPPADAVAAMEAATVAPHKEDPTPHPAYDDIPSLTTLFENRLT